MTDFLNAAFPYIIAGVFLDLFIGVIYKKKNTSN